MRKRWIGLMLLSVLAAAAVWCSAAYLQGPSAADSTARLLADPPELDLQSDTGERQQVEFVLTNAGNEPLTIEEVRTSCECTVAGAPDKHLLQTGQKTVLRVEVRPPGLGQRDTAIVIVTDAEAMPALRIPVRLRGRVLTPPYFRDWPREIRHSAVDSADVEIPFVVLCLERSAEDPWLLGFDTDSTRISVGQPEVLDTQVLDDTAVYRRYEAVIKLAAPESDGPPVTGVLRPRTRSEAVRPLPMIPVSISRTSVVRAIPSTLLVTRTQLAEGSFRRRVAVVSSTDDNWEIVSAEPSVPWVTAAMVPAGEPAHLLDIEITQAPSAAGAQATVRIKTTHPRCPELSISLLVE